MRRWIALLLLMTLPWQALASTGSWSMPCAMGEEAMATEADAGEGGMVDASSDCCNDFATWARTGLACQAGTVCMPASVWPALATFTLALPSPPTWPTPPWPAWQAPRFDPSGIWRPPTAG